MYDWKLQKIIEISSYSLFDIFHISNGDNVCHVLEWLVFLFSYFDLFLFLLLIYWFIYLFSFIYIFFSLS